MQNFSLLARKASFLVQVLQDLVQDLARKLLARLAYFLQDSFKAPTFSSMKGIHDTSLLTKATIIHSINSFQMNIC